MFVKSLTVTLFFPLSFFIISLFFLSTYDITFSEEKKKVRGDSSLPLSHS